MMGLKVVQTEKLSLFLDSIRYAIVWCVVLVMFSWWKVLMETRYKKAIEFIDIKFPQSNLVVYRGWQDI